MTARRGHRPENQHRFGPRRPVDFCDSKLDEWVAWQQAARLAPSTGKRRASTVDNFAREVNVNPVTATHQDITKWLSDRDDLSRSTSALYFEYLNAWFGWLVRMEYRADNPMVKLLKPKKTVGEPRPCSDEDLIRLLATRMHARTRVMILLAALTGLRVSEIARVKGEDIDVGRCLIWVVGKGSLRRSIPLHPLLLDAAQRMPRTGFWFPGEYERDGQCVRSTSVSTIIAGVMRRAGVPGTPHSLRHWFGTTLLSSGADLRTTQELMRHASVATTQLYTKVADVSRHDAVALLDPVGHVAGAVASQFQFEVNGATRPYLNGDTPWKLSCHTELTWAFLPICFRFVFPIDHWPIHSLNWHLSPLFLIVRYCHKCQKKISTSSGLPRTNSHNSLASPINGSGTTAKTGKFPTSAFRELSGFRCPTSNPSRLVTSMPLPNNGETAPDESGAARTPFRFGGVQMNDTTTATGYSGSADYYRNKGWAGVLPLEPRTKIPPPCGCSGRRNPSYPTDADIQKWKSEPKYRNGNLSLRMIGGPAHADAEYWTAGIDKDCHDGKTGAATIIEAESRWSPLPVTPATGSRTDGSGIMLFKVPVGTELAGVITFPELNLGGVEIIQWGHRYAVSHPSIHPTTGEQYRWTMGCNGPPTDYPAPAELAWLPEAWVAGLSVEAKHKGTPKSNGQARSGDDELREVVAEAMTEGRPNAEVAKRLSLAVNELTMGCHENTLHNVLALLRYGTWGYPGVETALESLFEVFVKWVGPDRPGGDQQAREEFEDFLTGPNLLELLADPDYAKDEDPEPFVGPPIPLTRVVDVPPFPVDAFPTAIRDMVNAVSVATQTGHPPKPWRHAL